VVKAYPQDVAVHLRHYPLGNHKNAEPAARAMQAAHRQGKGHEMAEKIFANMKALSADDLAKYAEDLGLDVGRFKTDWESQEVKDEVAKDLKAGQAAGVRGTPTIFVNGKRYQGPRSVDGFKSLIDEEIKAADELIKGGTPLDKVYETRAKANAG
jgi:predicted DsbA family dithiol-disulfide isomerase